MGNVFKRCGCCDRTYSKAEWAGLKFRGIQQGEMPLELRDCPCGSTLAIVLAEPPAPRPNTLSWCACSNCYEPAALKFARCSDCLSAGCTSARCRRSAPATTTPAFTQAEVRS